MTRQQLTFSMAGLIAGLITVGLGTVSVTVLTIGVGPLFFLAIFAATTLTGSWSHLSRSPWRYAAAILVCTIIYILALFTFSAIDGYLPQLFGISESSDINAFGADVWAGLIAAALVASAGVELVVYILTGKWSTSTLAYFLVAGIISISVTFVANLIGHHYWSFLGVLLPIGEAGFCALAGAQIRETISSARSGI